VKNDFRGLNAQKLRSRLDPTRCGGRDRSDWRFSQCPQRALQAGVLLFVENALEFFHLFLAEIIEGGLIEFGHVETIADYFRVWQDFCRRIDEAFVKIGADSFDDGS
jgi:hypothetical protein